MHFLEREHHEAHDVMICIGTGKMVHDEKRMRYVPELYFKSAEEMRALFPEHPEAISNTVAIAERCNLEAGIRNLEISRISKRPKARRAKQYLRELCYRGLREALRRSRDDGRGPDRPPRIRARRPREDRLRQLFPHRLGFHPFREGAAAFRSARAAVPPPDRWSLTSSGLPTSIRFSSVCSSSASSIRSAFRRRISTSIFANRAAAK